MNSVFSERVIRPPHLQRAQVGGWIAVLLIVVTGVLLSGCGPAAREAEPFRVVIVNPSMHGDRIARAFEERLAELAARDAPVSGRSVTVSYEGPLREPEQLEAAVRTGVDSGVDLLVCMTEFALQAVQQVDRDGTTPVLFWLIRDPVAAGLAQSAQHPGGRFSGVTTGFAGSLSEGRRLQYLAELGIERIFVPYNPDDVAVAQSIETVREAAADLGVRLLEYHVRTEAEARIAAGAIPAEADGIMLLPDRVIGTARIELAAAAIERGVVLSGPVENSVHDGALMAYAFREERIGQQLARMAFEVIRGRSVGEMPLETPEFSLSLNLATARAIGLNLPDSLVQQAELIIRE